MADKPMLPTDAQTRKNAPIYRGVMKYFPLALAAVAELSRIGNEQHNPGQPMHWNRAKSTDHLDCVARHMIDAGTIDIDKVRHSTKLAWRALANLQTELEEAAKVPVDDCIDGAACQCRKKFGLPSAKCDRFVPIPGHVARIER